jgi:hypothetical protein
MNQNIKTGKQSDQWLIYFAKIGSLIRHRSLLDSINIVQQDSIKILVMN